MKIEVKEITVRDLTNGYEDNQENGVVGFGGKLDIRPPYQREFIYKDKQRESVIDSLTTILRTGLVFYFSEITKVMISRGGFNETQVKRRV